MNILLINHYAGSGRHGMEYRPFFFAREWVRTGHNVTIVAASFSHLRSINPTVENALSEEKIEGVKYLWIRTNKYHGNSIGRILNMMTFVFRLIYFSRRIIDSDRPDAVIASSTYPLDIFPAFLISKRTRSKLIFEIHDLWPLSPVELGHMSKYNPLIVAMQIAENFACRKSARIVSLLPGTKNYLIKHGMNPGKFEYIPNGINSDEWDIDPSALPDEHKRIIKELQDNKRFIVCYAGAHGIANALHNLIDAAKLVENYPVTFILAGQGQEKEKLMKKSSMSAQGNVIFLNPVSKSAVPALLDAMDVLYIGLKAEPLFRFGVSPNKLLDYMMSAKPVIYAIESCNNIVDESGCGITTVPESPQDIAAAVIKLMSTSYEKRIEIGLNGRKYVEIKHDYRVLAKRFEDIMRN